MEMRAAFLAIETSAKTGDKQRTDKWIAGLPEIWARTRPLLQAERRTAPRTDS
jgi:hypothetical protein